MAAIDSIFLINLNYTQLAMVWLYVIQEQCETMTEVISMEKFILYQRLNSSEQKEKFLLIF